MAFELSDNDEEYDETNNDALGEDFDPKAADPVAEEVIPACWRGQETMSTHKAPNDPFNDPDALNVFLAGRPQQSPKYLPGKGPYDAM